MSRERMRPGGRSARVRDAVLDAVSTLVAETGYAGLSHETVAERAGVHKSTVYRWWPSKPELVRDAMLREAGDLVSLSDTGDLVADLRRFLRDIARGASSPLGHSLLLGVLRDVDEDDGRTAERRAFWAARFAPVVARLERERDAGALPHDLDIPLLVETLVAPIHFRVLLYGAAVDDEFVESLLRHHRLGGRR